jgi:hypothetical protein
MKKLAITLISMSGLLVGCGTSSQTQTTAEKWDSLPRLERIARDYAKQQAIAFDFTGSHPEVRDDPWHTNVAIIDFYHGMHQPVFEASIDRSGKVIETDIPTLEEAPSPN